MGNAKRDRGRITGRKQRVLAMAAAIPDRTDRMDHMLRRKPVALCDSGVSRRAAAKGTAFGQKLSSRGAMDGTIDAAPAKERRVCGVDDGVNAQCGDVSSDDFEACGTNLVRGQDQTAASTAMPLSANSCCNSPAWNISRMISHPPTNSPLT